jgi:enediyne biosynthesis protein E4
MKKIHLLLLIVYLVGCKSDDHGGTLFVKATESGINFENRISNSKDFNIFSYRNFYNGAGVATGDINNDGLTDIFFTANMGPNKLFLNKGNFKFEDISPKAGFGDKQQWSTGVVMVDINHDNLLDIYVCNAGYQKGVGLENQLWINKGNLTFEEKAADYGLNDPGFTTHAAFFDYDLDGDLDAYILNNSFIPVNTLNYSNKRDLRAEDWPVADFLKGGGDKLLRNDNGKFVDVSKSANIFGSLIGFGLGVTVGDVNNDRYPDIYVSNDFFERDYLYINQKDGTFKEELESRIQHLSHSSMGADMADINNDGHQDIFVTEMLPDTDFRLKTTTSFENVDVQRFKEKSGFYHQYMQNTLQLNTGNGKFKEVAHYSGVSASDWSWGALMFDADNDGLNDIYVCNGIYNDVTDQDFIDFFANDVVQRMVMTGKKEEIEEIIKKMPSVPIENKMFRNKGDLAFEDVGMKWGLRDKTFSNGASYADLDNDGDLDLIINNVNQPAIVYKNNSREINKNHFIKVRLTGKGQNTMAIGSRVSVFAGNTIHTKELIPSRGFQSSVDYTLLFGLGTASKIDSVQVLWPDLKRTTLLNVKVDTMLVIDEQQAIPFGPGAAPAAPLFTEKPAGMQQHEEDDHVDFYLERNIPRLLSRIGPRAAVADVNGDGLEDVYVSGTLKKPGQLYLQSGSGFAVRTSLSEQLKGFEDIAAIFFDADNDGDKDLMLGAGGNHRPSYTKENQNRLYLNNGKGDFTRVDSLPKNMGNTAVLIAMDIDNDGDQDVFSGSCSMPVNYGVTPVNCFYLNDGKGKFNLMSKEQCGALTNAGMITGAVWQKQTSELVVVGEWMSPKVFKYSGGRFTETKTNLDSLSGWWQAVQSADLDGDGDEDLVLGNIGRNFYLRPDAKQPVKLWINEFSNNMIPEKIITKTLNGKDVPVFLKRELTDQIPVLKKQNLRHQDYATKSIQDLFPPEQIKSSEVKLFNYMLSCVAWNEGNGKYTVQELPTQVQFSSVNAIVFADVNNDGRKDIIAGGNIMGFLPQFSRVDASYGHVLINNGNHQWSYVNEMRSGIELSGEVRDIKEIRVGNKPGYLFLRNSDFPVFYSISEK